MKSLLSFMGWTVIGFVLWQSIVYAGIGLLLVLTQPAFWALFGLCFFAWALGNYK